MLYMFFSLNFYENAKFAVHFVLKTWENGIIAVFWVVEQFFLRGSISTGKIDFNIEKKILPADSWSSPNFTSTDRGTFFEKFRIR